MAKRWSANSLVAQVLLICLVGTNVEVLGQNTKNPQPSHGQQPIRHPSQPGSQPSYPGQNPQTNFPPNVKPSYPGQNPQTNFPPNVKPSNPGQNPQTNFPPNFKPSNPGQNPQTNFQQNVKPSNPGQNPQTNLPPNFKPSNPGQNPQTNFPPNFKPSNPGQNPQTNFPPNFKPSYPGQNPQTNFQQNVKPSNPGQNPQIQVQQGSQSSYSQNRRPTLTQDFAQKPQQSQYTQSQQPPHQQSPQQPKYPQPSQPSKNTHGPSEPSEPRLVCGVDQHVRIQCGHYGISGAECEAIECCYQDQQCYFGKYVTLVCTKDAQIAVVVAKDATLPHLIIDTISLEGEGPQCEAVDSNSEFAIFQFPVLACGSVVTEEPDTIIYTNKMTSSYEVGVGPNGIITRDSSFELFFQCRYTGLSIDAVLIEILPSNNPPLPVAALGPIRVELRLGNGECESKGCNEVEAAYSSYYTEGDYPVTEVLRDPVYVEVRLLEKTDPNLVLTLGRCWVTNSPNPHHQPQWDLLIDGCPYRDDRYLSSLVPVGPSSGLPFPTHYKRFIFKMFTFVDSSTLVPQREEVYIHCGTSVCTRAEGRTCEPSCQRQKREAEATHYTRTEPQLVVTVGPVTIVEESTKRV